MTADPPRSGAPPERLEAVIRGRVQGVGFRMFVGRAAAIRGLVGWVANESDGSVRCVAEGPRPDLEAFARDLADGPSGSDVERIETTWSAATGTFDRFALRSGWHGGD
jgi:acylphosphatase